MLKLHIVDLCLMRYDEYDKLWDVWLCEYIIADIWMWLKGMMRIMWSCGMWQYDEWLNLMEWWLRYGCYSRWMICLSAWMIRRRLIYVFWYVSRWSLIYYNACLAVLHRQVSLFGAYSDWIELFPALGAWSTRCLHSWSACHVVPC